MKSSYFVFINLFTLLIPNLNIHTQNLIPIPDTLSGNSIDISIKEGEKQFYNGINTKTISYNGSYLGPTLILKKGQKLNLHVENKLSDTTTTHWHGLHVSPANDGSPHNPILPGQSWNPSFTIMDKASTCWYHPHLHGKTFQQVIKGAAGIIMVRDSEEAGLVLPRTYGIDDIPLIFQFQNIDAASKQILLNDELDNTTMVNGTIDPMLNCPAQIIRLRLLNASGHRVFRFGFKDGRTFYQIAGDGGLLNAPVALTKLNLGNGERAEILVDFSGQEGKSFYIQQFGNELPQGFMGGPSMMGMQLGPLDNKTFNLLKINVIPPVKNAVTTIPQYLTTNQKIPESGALERTIRLSAQPMMSTTNFFINNAKFDEEVINFKVKQDDVEIWTITNQTMMAHPFHIHGNPFYILSINGSLPSENLQGRKDVVMIPPMNGSVKLITKYSDFSDPDFSYMYHCHILTHEDNGMMGQFLVTSNTTTNTINLNDTQFKLWPVPTTGSLSIFNSKNSITIESVKIFDLMGRTVLSYIFSNESNFEKINLDQLPDNQYILNIFSNTGLQIFKVLKI
jgi:bilirubin oxidase